MKYNNGPMIMEFTGVTMVLTTLKQLAWQKIELSFEDSVPELARWQYLAGLYTVWISVQYIWCYFSDSKDSLELGSRGGDEKDTTHYHPWWPTSKMFASYSHNLMLCWLRDLSSKGRNVSARDTTMTPLNWKLRLLPGHFGLLRLLN